MPSPDYLKSEFTVKTWIGESLGNARDSPGGSAGGEGNKARTRQAKTTAIVGSALYEEIINSPNHRIQIR